ncbi:MAG: DUF3187 family protein [Deltaproteobacteria bacterium]|nr:DUF3187 family protein [Deltaproteobacteria bacterium]
MPKKQPLFLTMLTVLLLTSPVFSLEGPLGVKNQFPLFLHLNVPIMEKAAQEDSLAVNLQYSSIFMKKESADWLVDLDLELAELDIAYKKNFPGRVEIGLELPMLGFSSGVLDQPLETYHDAFGFPDYGRSRFPKNEFHYRLFRNGKLLVAGESGRVGLGDLRLTAKKEFPFGPCLLAVKGELELPTGDPNTGFGNGSLGGGLALIGEWKPGGPFNLTGILGLVAPGDLKALETVDLQPYYYLGVSGEWAVWRNWEVLGQVLAQTSPYPETGISSVDRPGVILTLGGRYAFGLNSVEFSFTEDLNVTGAPDFIFQLGFKHKFK